MFDTVVYQRLSGDAQLIALCPRITANQPTDQTDFPFAWYKASRSDQRTFSGPAANISNYTFEINCFSKTVSELKSIVARIIALLNGWSSSTDVAGMILDDFAEETRENFYVYSLRFKTQGA